MPPGMSPEEGYGFREHDHAIHATLFKTKRHRVPCKEIVHRRPDAISKKVIPGVRRFWYLPHIEPPYPPVKAREPTLDPST